MVVRKGTNNTVHSNKVQTGSKKGQKWSKKALLRRWDKGERVYLIKVLVS